VRSVWEREKSVSFERNQREMKKNRGENIYRKTKLDGSRAIENLSSTNSQQI